LVMVPKLAFMPAAIEVAIPSAKAVLD